MKLNDETRYGPVVDKSSGRRGTAKVVTLHNLLEEVHRLLQSVLARVLGENLVAPGATSLGQPRPISRPISGSHLIVLTDCGNKDK